MSENKPYLAEKTIRVVKTNCQCAIGWGVLEDGTILVEVNKSSWERLEEHARMNRGNIDFDLAETILQGFNNA